jgi:hypothetical protein
MIEKRYIVDRCVAELEMAQMTLNNLSSGQSASQDEILRAAIKAKRLEVKLAMARLAQTEYYLDSLKARREYLEVRCSQGSATGREHEEYKWIKSALPINSATVARLSEELDRRKAELEQLMTGAGLASTIG